ncbi:MAG: diguanylate cyclase [Candidatus Nitrospinota bacterium M3_3B_026]
MNKDRKIRVGIIGAGDGAYSLLEILSGDTEVAIAGLAYRSGKRPAVMKARDMGVPLHADFRKLAESDDVDILIDASGAREVEEYLTGKKSRAELLTGYGAWFLWRMVEEYKKRQEEMKKNLKEKEILYSAGVMLASAANTETTLDLIMESALNLTGMEAGSIALYDEEKGTMQIKTSLGFEKIIPDQKMKWRLRPGGLTSHILSNDRPTVIENLEKEKKFDTRPLREMGVGAIIAVPLKVEGKIVGILYVDDFRPRKFTEREVNILSLLGAHAAAAIDKALLLEKAEFMAITDELTKLYNHRYFIRALDSEIRRASRYTYPISLLMIDVDYFKNYNDTFGHLEGNVVLTTLARIFTDTARETDVVARYGGEEFAIILTKADEKKGVMVAERIRSKVKAHAFAGAEEQPNGKLTVSIGAATYPADAKNSRGLIEMADKALYRSKKRGRDSVTHIQTVETGAETLSNVIDL